MTQNHETKKKATRVSEAMAVPVQVFLGYSDQTLLDRLIRQLNITKSEVLRRGLAALERQMLDPNTHPALQIIGLVDADDNAASAVDPALHHDQVIADSHEYTQPSGKRRRAKS